VLGVGLDGGLLLERYVMLLVLVTGWIIDIWQYCTITPQSEVPAGATIPDHTVVYGNNMRRMDKRGVAALMNKAQTQQIAVLRTKIPSNPAKFQ
jgi:hypothetical protein